MSRAEPKAPRVVLVSLASLLERGLDKTALWRCAACGVLGGVTLPTSASEVSRACDAFGKAHRACKAGGR